MEELIMPFYDLHSREVNEIPRSLTGVELALDGDPRRRRSGQCRRGPLDPASRDSLPAELYARRASVAARIWERVGCELVKRLYLLRHAKSNWKDASLSDRERPLAGRGRRAAKAMARHLDEAGVEAQLVLCSAARRTLETLERIRPALPGSHVQVEPELYRADAADLLERLRRVPDAVDSVMVIGHNPALQELALGLARPGSLTSRLADKYPTGALVELEVPVDSWTVVGEGGGQVVSFIRPRDL